jgi:hypothetical protein
LKFVCKKHAEKAKRKFGNKRKVFDLEVGGKTTK